MSLHNSPPNLSEVGPSVQALIYHLRQESGPQITERKSYYDFEWNAYAYEMSNGTVYFLNEINQWIAVEPNNA